MEIVVNMIFEWVSSEKSEKKIERILQIYPDNETIVTIDIFDKAALPVLREKQEIIAAYKAVDLRILEYNPFSNIDSPDSEISDKYLKRRNEAWNLVEKLIQSAKGNLFFAKNSISVVSKETGKPPKTLYHYLRRYLQSGCLKNSLLPQYKKCGGKGKKRFGKESSEKKLGRPSELAKKHRENSGIRITSTIEILFEKGIRKFYLTPEKNSFRAAYEMMIAEYFNVGYDYINGVKVPILPDAKKLPTERQLRYWYESNLKDPQEEKKSRLGENKFNLLHRNLFGDSTSLSLGPGSVYMIDATIADVYLVSSFDRYRIIGRPVVYLIVDVFSRLVVGFSVSLEGPSWLGAILALDNMITDKVVLCNSYGIQIEKWQWDCHHLPVAIFADRGEFEGYNADVLVNVLGITIHNTSPYRGDLKGIVERHFGIAKEKFIKFIPGAVIKGRERGEKDHRLDAKLTLNEFRALMITHILDYNHNHKLTWYHPDEFQVADHVPLKPINLWNWGKKNRSGLLRFMPQNDVRMNLLPRKQLTVSRYGIHFEKDIYYEFPPSIKLRGKSNKVTVAYDPRILDHIYLLSEFENGKIISCPLTPASKLYLGRDYQEVDDLFALQCQDDEIDQTRQLQTKAKFRADANHIIKKAEIDKQNQSSSDHESNASKLRNIRQNRLDERNYERSINSWFEEDKSSINKQLTSGKIIADEEYISAPDYFDEIDAALEGGEGE
jgi:putative transposase